MHQQKPDPGRKKVSSQAITGQRGVNLVEQVVLEMGCTWHPTNQSLEAGVDGEIELVEPASRAATNLVVRVQVKATLSTLPAETDSSFEYRCDERDLNYWLSGNTPLILIVTKPQSREAYWADIKATFSTIESRKSRKIRFDKRTMAFDKNALAALFSVGVPRSQGLYFAPPPRPETLYTNLVPVTRTPKRLWLAESELRSPRDMFTAQRERGFNSPEFVLGNRRLLTAHDLTDDRWKGLVDRGTVEEFDVREWSSTTDGDKHNQFLELLDHCLTARARQIGVRRRRDDGALYFGATPDLSTLTVRYESVKESSSRNVFQAYLYTKGEHLGEVLYYRHSACHTKFRRYDGEHYLEILPEYHYTSDGFRQHPRSQTFLSGIKKRERQGAVLYQLVMWASMLRGHGETEDDLFKSDVAYPYLGFGPLQTLTLDVGIDDDGWLPNEDAETEAVGIETMGQLPLFSDVDSVTVDADALEEQP